MACGLKAAALASVFGLAMSFNSGHRWQRCDVNMMAKTKKEMRARYPNAGKLSYVLTEDAPPWGKEGEVLRVSRGFAMNYLVPRSLAVPASPEIIAEAEAKRVAAEAERLASIEAAQAVANKLAAIGKFSITRKVGDQGKVFGSITATDVIGVISAAAKVDLDGTKISFASKTMDTLGDYPLTLMLHPEVSVSVTLSLVEAD